jgi:hypothetical protein
MVDQARAEEIGVNNAVSTVSTGRKEERSSAVDVGVRVDMK